MDTQKNDPAKYHRLSAPKSTAEKANEDLNAFYEAIDELREKHGIPDVLIAVQMVVQYDKDSATAMSFAHYGSAGEAEGLAAYAYGQTSAQRREAVNRLISAKGTSKTPV